MRKRNMLFRLMVYILSIGIVLSLSLAAVRTSLAKTDHQSFAPMGLSTELERTQALVFATAFYDVFPAFVFLLSVIFMVMQVLHVSVSSIQHRSHGRASAKARGPSSIGSKLVSRRVSGETVAADRRVKRFTDSQRWEHAILIVSFTLLLSTGLLQRYYASWGHIILRTPESLAMIRQIHLFASAALILEVLYHLGKAIRSLVQRKLSSAIFFTEQDIRDAWTEIRRLFFLTDQKPLYGKYRLDQKVTYWFVFFSLGAMLLTGVILWFPTFFTRFFPQSILPIASSVHSGEALALTIFVLAWHIFHELIQRFNLSIFTGWQTELEMREYHVREYETVNPESVGYLPGASEGPGVLEHYKREKKQLIWR